MTRWIDPKDQKAARDNLRILNNKKVTRDYRLTDPKPTSPIPKAKTFNVNEWANIVARMGRIGAVAGRMDMVTTIEEAKRLHDMLASELTWLGRELAGGTK